MNFRFVVLCAAALLMVLLQVPSVLADAGALPQPSNARAYGPSPYYMPDLSQKAAPPPAFGDIAPTYYSGGPARSAASSPTAFGPSPYYTPDISRPAAPTSAFGDIPPTYYSGGPARSAGAAPTAYGPSPYYMPNVSPPPKVAQQAIGPSPYYMPDLSRTPARAPAPIAVAQQPRPQQEPGPATVNTADTGDDVEVAEISFNDPLEPLNRFFFGFNNYLEEYLVSPIVTVYNWLPVDVRGSVSNFLSNLNSPVVLANDLLQFEFARAWQTTERLLINTTMGIGGLFDVAEEEPFAIAGHSEDFGQTLGSWGVGEMFYLVLPLFGPSSPRDAVGKMFVDSYFDPIGYWLKGERNDGMVGTNTDAILLARSIASSLDKYANVKSELDTIKKTSIDYYATIRSMYRQKRERDIANGNLSMPSIPDYNLDEIDIDLE